MKLITSLVVLSALVSCAPAPEIKKRSPLFTTEEKLVVLSDKADKEIMSAKYNNSINLRCDFIIDNKPDANITLNSAFYFSVNLAAGEHPINLTVFKNGHNFTVGFRVKQFDILPENKITYANGVTEILKDTPLVELLVRGREVKGNFDKKYDRSVYVNEKQPVIITDLFPEKYPHILKCQLETVISENYKEQNEIILPTKEDPEIVVIFRNNGF